MQIKKHGRTAAKREQRNKYLRYAAAAGLLGVSGAYLAKFRRFHKLIPESSLEGGHTSSYRIKKLQEAMMALYGKAMKKRGVTPEIITNPDGPYTGFRGTSESPKGYATRIYINLPDHMKGGARAYPGAVAHEMGHAVTGVKNPRLLKSIWRHDQLLKGDTPETGHEETYALVLGAAGASLGTVATKRSKMSPRTKRLITGALIATPFLLKSPKLADEALASIRGLRILKKAGYSFKERAKEAGRLAGAFGTYAREPLLLSTLPASIAIAIPSQPRNKRGSK